jgi:hypothetical protein
MFLRVGIEVSPPRPKAEFQSRASLKVNNDLRKERGAFMKGRANEIDAAQNDERGLKGKMM